MPVQGLTRDGVVGPATWARLATPYVPAPRYPMPTASLEVNLSKQLIYYVRNGAIERIIDASTGSGAWYYSYREACPVPAACQNEAETGDIEA